MNDWKRCRLGRLRVRPGVVLSYSTAFWVSHANVYVQSKPLDESIKNPNIFETRKRFFIIPAESTAENRSDIYLLKIIQPAHFYRIHSLRFTLQRDYSLSRRTLITGMDETTSNGDKIFEAQVLLDSITLESFSSTSRIERQEMEESSTEPGLLR